MNALLKDLLSLVRGSVDAARVVPPTGISAWLIVFTAAAMTFLAVVAFTFSVTAARIAQGWTDELASSLTVRISAPIEQMDQQTEATLQVLRTTPGILRAQIIETEEQAVLLEPWLGSGFDLEAFSLPQLIAVEETGEGPDRESLRLRLEAEAPAAEIDDHGRWREPLIAAANRIRGLGTVVLVLVLAGLMAVVVLAAQAAVVSNANNISTLRLIGARDTFIVRAFVRRITLRALAGAVLGTAIALVFVALQPDTGELPATLRLSGREWWLACLIVPVVGVITFFTTRITAFFTLKRLS